MALVYYLRVCSQRYIVVHVELVDFLRLWRQLNNTQQISCLSGAVSNALRIYYTPVYLAIYDCCSQRFLCHGSYVCTSLNHKLELCGQDSTHAHAQLSHVYLASTLDVTHMIKGTRFSPTLAGKVWERG